jgi:hypothetical protein
MLFSPVKELTVFIQNLFSDAVINSDDIASIDRICE